MTVFKWNLGQAAFASLTMAGSMLLAGENAADLNEPIRIQADGRPIDHGSAWGHAGPCIHDVDGDRKRDLVVGDFSGTFTWYRNVGTNAQPQYETAGMLMAGGEPAKVWIYCCIGSSPQFADLNGDGRQDLISGSYDPGACYWFPGDEHGAFQPRAEDVIVQFVKNLLSRSGDAERDPHANANGYPITDRTGRVILRKPDQVESYESFGSWPCPVDWDADDDWDLLIGGFDGSVWLRENLGTKTEFAFSETPVAVEAAGEPIMFKSKTDDGTPSGHAAVVAADWDGDGLFDIISGCADGSIRWFPNTGRKGKPQFAKAKILVDPPEQDGYGRFLEPGEAPRPGIRSQVAVADMNGDGRMDLLVGDFSTTRSPRANLSPKERAGYEAARDSLENARDPYFAATRKARKTAMDVFDGIPEEKRPLNENQEKWRKRLDELRNEPKYLALKGAYESAKKELEKYLKKAPKEWTSFNDYTVPHGFVWLYLRN